MLYSRGPGVTTRFTGTECAILGMPLSGQKIDIRVSLLVKSQKDIHFWVLFKKLFSVLNFIRFVYLVKILDFCHNRMVYISCYCETKVALKKGLCSQFTLHSEYLNK